MLHFHNTFRNLPHFFYEDVTPTPIMSPKLMVVSSMKEELEITMSDAKLVDWLNGEFFLKDEQRLASRYAGHQFGVWAGQLGDGRAISLGELDTSTGHWEIQTKGSGITPFSRMGDGKAVIRSSVREYVCSEAMAGLRIPTTRVLALMTGEDNVYRERVEKSALVARVFPTNLRFGHFEMAFHYKKTQELRALIDYTRTNFFDNVSVEEMLKEIVRKTATLMAHWQNVGFCHGVMNTDNMSILGLTIDYGPFGFLEDTKLSHICNHTDQNGRYAYNQQPSVAMWNLERLFVCFLEIVPRETLENILNEYPMIFEEEYLFLSRKKLGFYTEEDHDFKFMINTLQVLNQLSIDYTFFFRQLAVDPDLNEIWAYYGERTELRDWHKKYQDRLRTEILSPEERKALMIKTNPKYVLKNYIAQEIIEKVEAGSNKELKDWLDVFKDPFSEHPSYDAYSRPTPPEHKDYEVSCSS